VQLVSACRAQLVPFIRHDEDEIQAALARREDAAA
jgi:hypothetical protein